MEKTDFTSSKWSLSSASSCEDETVNIEDDCTNFTKSKSVPPKLGKLSHTDVPHWYKIFNYRGEKVLNCFESYLLPHININLDEKYDGCISKYHLIKLFYKIRTYYRAILTGRFYLLNTGFQYKIEEYNNKTLMIMAVPKYTNTTSAYTRRLDSAINFRFLRDFNGTISENIRIIMPEHKAAANFGEPILVSIPISLLWQQDPKPSLFCNCSDLPKIMEILQPTSAFNHKNLCIYKKLITFTFLESHHPHYIKNELNKASSVHEKSIADESNIEDILSDEMINIENLEKPIDLVVRHAKVTFTGEPVTPVLAETDKSGTPMSTSSFLVSKFGDRVDTTEEIDVENCEPEGGNHLEVDSENLGDLLVMALSVQRKKHLSKKMKIGTTTWTSSCK